MAQISHFYSGMAEVNGTGIFYEVAGQGHPLVMIHSGYSNRKLWDDQFELFAQSYKMIRYDVRGYGNSAVVTADTPLYADWQDLYETREQQWQNCKHCIYLTEVLDEKFVLIVRSPASSPSGCW